VLVIGLGLLVVGLVQALDLELSWCLVACLLVW